MFKIIPIIFLSLFIHEVSLSETPDILSINIQRCIFYIEPPQANITFLYCEMPSNPNQTQWKTCIDTCCNNITVQADSIPKYETLKICQDMSVQEASTDAITIVMFIGVSIGCTLVFVCFFQMIYKAIASSLRSQITQNGLTISGIRQQRQNLNSILSKIVWLKKDESSLIATDIVCTICLEQKCLVQLPCKHSYHAQCITSWLKKSRFCPLCHLDNISTIKHYCQECLEYYFILKIRIFEKNCSSFKILRCTRCTEVKIKNSKKIPQPSLRPLQEGPKIETSTQNIAFSFD